MSFRFLFVLAVVMSRAIPAQAADVTTYHNDLARSGANLAETILTPANIQRFGMGKLFSYNLDGFVYAQPLYLSAVPTSLGTRNILYIATEHDSVFALDADDPHRPELWQRSFLSDTPGATTVPSADVGSTDITPEIGITATPVIDRALGAIYVVDKIKQVTAGRATYQQRLHALDLVTGAERFGGPVTIDASVRGMGAGSVGGTVSFNALRENNRSGLALVNGVVYLSFASHGDKPPYHGWVLGYDSRTLKQVAVYNVTPNGLQGGIWQSGGAPAADGLGHLFVITGNGDFNQRDDFGDSVLRLGTRAALPGLVLEDAYTPANQSSLEQADADLGSGGVMLLPDAVGSAVHRHLMIGAGKEGNLLLIDRDHLGGFSAMGDRIVQKVNGAIGRNFGTPAFFNGLVYFQGAKDVLKAFAVLNGQLSMAPLTKTAIPFDFPGSIPSVSANGTQDPIVWVIRTDGFQNGTPAVLIGYPGKDLSVEVFNSAKAPGGRDQGPGAIKFSVPTIADGKVFVPGQRAVSVYGLKGH